MDWICTIAKWVWSKLKRQKPERPPGISLDLMKGIGDDDEEP